MNTTPQILIVDDQLETCLLLEEIFRALEIEVAFAGTLKHTGELLNRISPSIVIIDHLLPDGFGFDYIPQIRQKLPDCRIVAMTALLDSQTRFHAFKEGANSFLEKPFSVQEVYQAVMDPKVPSYS